jgi:hypothetical protein
MTNLTGVQTGRLLGQPRSVQLCGMVVNSSCDPETSLAAYSSLCAVPNQTELSVLWEVESASRLWVGALRFTILPREW